jgi:S-adenosylmethionine:tRNA ribosyltransferase-isomerase
MKTTDFSFNLPEELIAQNPSAQRGNSRLLVLDRGSGRREHSQVSRLDEFVGSGTLMVFNDTRVRKARLFGVGRRDGREREYLLLGKKEGERWEFLSKGAKSLKDGDAIDFPEGVRGDIERGGAGEPTIRFQAGFDEAYLERCGHIPLPPYIRREDGEQDAERYQTVYARSVGSSAAPTAGLHFTRELLARLEGKGIETAFVTLHVGLGTFLPVRSENIEGHTMHEEEYLISDETADKVERAKREKRPVLAVGTTSLRSLESAWDGEGARLRRGWRKTSIFIRPGYRFGAVDQLFTNFHTPESTLLMLVSAFAGYELVRETYAEAIEMRYRFFSYGDAMLIQ